MFEKLSVDVGPYHIVYGTPDAYDCPIAKAIRDIPGVKYATVGRYSASMVDDDGNSHWYAMSRRASNFVLHFDSPLIKERAKAQPAKFILKEIYFEANHSIS